MIVYTNKHKIPFQIDEEDYESISRYTWWINSGGYPSTKIGYSCQIDYIQYGTLETIRIQRFLLGIAPEGFEWDHWNKDKLDNRRENIRAVTHTTNVRNINIRNDNWSGHTGIHVNTRGEGYLAIIGFKGETIRLGIFPTLEEAITARKEAEIRIWRNER